MKTQKSAPTTKNIVKTTLCLADCFSPEDGIAYFLKGKRYKIYTQGPKWMSLWDEEGGRQFVSDHTPFDGLWNGAFDLPTDYYNAKSVEEPVTLSLFASAERAETNIRTKKYRTTISV